MKPARVWASNYLISVTRNFAGEPIIPILNIALFVAEPQPQPSPSTFSAQNVAEPWPHAPSSTFLAIFVAEPWLEPQ